MKRYIIAHKSSQTGDTVHVAGALELDPAVCVIVVHVGGLESTEGLLNFYRQATDPAYPHADISPDSVDTNHRVKAVYASSKNTAAAAAAADALYDALSSIPEAPTDKDMEQIRTSFDNIFKAGVLFYRKAPGEPKEIDTFETFKAQFLTFPGDEIRYMGVLGQATQTIADKFAIVTKDQLVTNYKYQYTTISQRLTARNLKSAEIITGTINEPKFGTLPLPDPAGKRPIILLWARYTGTNTAKGHNPDGDSCVQGQRQIYDLLKGLGYDVVTIGHGPRGSQPFRGDFDVGEFYKQPPISDDRATQQSFFLALMEKYPGRLYQIGQKTGGMDGAALLGIPTIYLEPNGSASIERMKKWSNGALPFYEACITQQPAPAVVRAMRAYIPDTEKIYNEWKKSKIPSERARARIALMLYAYPKLMGKPEWTLGSLPEMPKNAPRDKWEPQQLKLMNQERFKKIVAFVDTLDNEKDVQEDPADPTKDGQWTKMVQKVNQSPDIPVGDAPGTAGYSARDMMKLDITITNLVTDYSGGGTGQVVLRTKEGYQTRKEAKLL